VDEFIPGGEKDTNNHVYSNEPYNYACKRCSESRFFPNPLLPKVHSLFSIMFGGKNLSVLHRPQKVKNKSQLFSPKSMAPFPAVPTFQNVHSNLLGNMFGEKKNILKKKGNLTLFPSTNTPLINSPVLQQKSNPSPSNNFYDSVVAADQSFFVNPLRIFPLFYSTLYGHMTLNHFNAGRMILFYFCFCCLLGMFLLAQNLSLILRMNGLRHYCLYNIVENIFMLCWKLISSSPHSLDVYGQCINLEVPSNIENDYNSVLLSSFTNKNLGPEPKTSNPEHIVSPTLSIDALNNQLSINTIRTVEGKAPLSIQSVNSIILPSPVAITATLSELTSTLESNLPFSQVLNSNSGITLSPSPSTAFTTPKVSEEEMKKRHEFLVSHVKSPVFNDNKSPHINEFNSHSNDLGIGNGEKCLSRVFEKEKVFRFDQSQFTQQEKDQICSHLNIITNPQYRIKNVNDLLFSLPTLTISHYLSDERLCFPINLSLHPPLYRPMLPSPHMNSFNTQFKPSMFYDVFK
jgi:hypothetical protein